MSSPIPDDIRETAKKIWDDHIPGNLVDSISKALFDAKQSSGWRLDIESAPRNNTIILATKCGKVTTSRWIEKEQRWSMLAAGEKPVAWMAWPTHPNITKSSDGERPIEVAGSEQLSADHVRPPASQAATGSGSANMEQGDVDRSAPRAGHTGQQMALAGQVESQSKAMGCFERNASLAAREGDKSLHSNSTLRCDLLPATNDAGAGNPAPQAKPAPAPHAGGAA